MRFFVSIIFFWSLVFCQAQQNFDKKLDSVKRIKDYSLQIQLLETWEEEVKVLEEFQLGEFYHTLALAYYRNTNYSESIESLKKALIYKGAARETNPLNFQKSLNLLQLSYQKNGNVTRQLETLHGILGEKKFTKYTHYAYRRLAIYYNEIGDYFQSIEYSERIIHDYSTQKDQSYYMSYYVRSLITVINSYAEMRTHDSETLERIYFYENKVHEVIEWLSADQEFEFYNSLGVIYRGAGKKEMALKSYQRSLKSIEGTEDRSALHGLYVNIGEMYSQLGNPKKAHEYYQRVLSTKDSVNISAVYNNIGYYHTKSVDEEIELHQKALRILENESDLSGDSFFPEDIKNSPYKEEFFSVYVDLSQAWIKKYNQDQNPSYLEEALKVLYKIDNFISVIRLDSSTKASKLFWISRGGNSYLEAVKVCYLLNKPEEAFYFMEKNKSLYLLEQLKRIQIKNEHKIPTNVLEREGNLKYQLLLAKSNLDKQSDDVNLQKAYKKAYQEQFKFLDSLHNKIPEFFKNPSSTTIISLSDFQSFLRKRNFQAVEYFMGDVEGYGLWLYEDQLHFFKLENYAKLLESLILLKQYCTRSSMTVEEVKSYRKHASFVFETLFPFENAKQYLQSKELKIIPSGVLYNFQFENLIVQDTKRLKDAYLIQMANVSYLNSATVTKKLYVSEKIKSYSYLGIAPVNFHQEKLSDLKNSEEVTKKISSLFSSKIKLKEKATKKAFLDASNALILHVNTHAGINEQTQLPWISMQDSTITLEELYVKGKPHNLVFLDACKTADGKLQRGEGIESLSKAFFHTGTKSVIASQWNANEKTTNEIALLFFQELKKGNSKSIALRNAKIAYLEKSQLSEALPYFWASLTLTGNSDVLPELSNTLHYWIVISFFLVVIILLQIRKRRKV